LAVLTQVLLPADNSKECANLWNIVLETRVCLFRGAKRLSQDADNLNPLIVTRLELVG
jgi:hypothetical protein